MYKVFLLFICSLANCVKGGVFSNPAHWFDCSDLSRSRSSSISHLNDLFSSPIQRCGSGQICSVCVWQLHKDPWKECSKLGTSSEGTVCSPFLCHKNNHWSHLPKREYQLCWLQMRQVLERKMVLQFVVLRQRPIH